MKIILSLEFDFGDYKRKIRSPRPELERAISAAVFDHIREVSVEQQQLTERKHNILSDIELPPSLAKLKEDQSRRNIWKKKQQKLEEEAKSLKAFGEQMSHLQNNTNEVLPHNDTLQFHAQPTHFQDSVRTKEPFGK